MKKKRKPNYKLRRNIAKFILILLIFIPIIIINKTKIVNAPLYFTYREYSKVLDALFEVNYDNKEVVNIITDLKKNNKINDSTDDYILELNNKGYSHNTINFILLNLDKKDITKMLNNKYSKDFEEYIKLPLFNYNKYNRYLSYQKKNTNLSLEDVTVQIELDLDKEHYEDAVLEDNPDSITALVNKHRYLDEKYEPSDLVDMDDKYANNTYRQMRIRKEVYEEFKKMVDDAKDDGIKFYAESAYRTYSFQDNLYKEYVVSYGQAKADTFAARPGYSEHQLGTSLDIANTWTIKEDSKEYKWIDENGYKYGFIFRYKEKNENITGYKAESWHIRYVGKDAATYIHNHNITFDEYYAKFIITKNKK